MAVPARANDAEAEIGIGGIVLRPSKAVVMAAEDLFISKDIVRVKYRFENPTDTAVETTVAFPLPGQPRGMMDQWFAMEEKHKWDDFGFSTRVDGVPVRLKAIELAVIDGKDVTAAVRAAGLPLDWYLDAPFMNSIPDMPEAKRAALVKQGLLRPDPRFDGSLLPAWDVATWFVREQVFPPRASVTVEHEYVPQAGGSVGGALYPSFRKESPETLAQYRREYCTDADFLNGIDRRLAAKPPAGKQVIMTETWLGYVLSSGAHWKGPIGDFRLVVDKGSTENLVSFCMDGVRKIGPTQFEVRKTNFEPRRDLKILIANFDYYDSD